MSAPALRIVCTFQSTLSMRRATSYLDALRVLTIISIHALHEESDSVQSADYADRRHISIHALHEESDLQFSRKRFDMSKFQSTLSMRRATRYSVMFPASRLVFQSTLSMRRATSNVPTEHHRFRISIHALHEESDLSYASFMRPPPYFNPRSP